MRTKKRIILMGGAFDPPTLDGHGHMIRHVMHTFGQDQHTEIFLMPSANGPDVLGKELKTSGEDRYRMTCLLANALQQPDSCSSPLFVSTLEMALSDITGMPSYTANTLIVLRQGLMGLLKHPENLLTVQEKKTSDEAQCVLIQARQTKISNYLTSGSQNRYLTANGILQDDDDIVAVYGADALTRLPQWYDLNTLAEQITQLYFLPRANIDLEVTKERLALHYPELATKITTANPLEGASPYASSTRVRQALLSQYVNAGHLAEIDWPSRAEAAAILSQSLLPEVYQYIQLHQLYSFSE